MSQCKSCGKAIVWLKTERGKNIPVDADSVSDKEAKIFDPDTMVSHFATCPDADRFRRKICIFIMAVITCLSGCATPNKSSWIDVPEKSLTFKEAPGRTEFIRAEDRKNERGV